MPITPDNGHVDPIFLGIGISICLVIAAWFFHREMVLRWRKKQELLREPDVETKAFFIACQIRKCKTPEDFNKAVAAIGKYEWQFDGDNNAKREAKILKEILDVKAAEVFGVETIFS
jgi:hypothetical protein